MPGVEEPMRTLQPDPSEMDLNQMQAEVNQFAMKQLKVPGDHDEIVSTSHLHEQFMKTVMQNKDMGGKKTGQPTAEQKT